MSVRVGCRNVDKENMAKRTDLIQSDSNLFCSPAIDNIPNVSQELLIRFGLCRETVQLPNIEVSRQ